MLLYLEVLSTLVELVILGFVPVLNGFLPVEREIDPEEFQVFISCLIHHELATHKGSLLVCSLDIVDGLLIMYKLGKRIGWNSI